MSVPEIYRPLIGKLRVFIPVAYGEGKTVRPWLKEVCGDGVHLTFDSTDKRWLVGRDHLVALRDALVTKQGSCTVVSDNRISNVSKCDSKCVNADGDECVCSCGGVNHRGTYGDYVPVGETTLVRQEAEYWTTSRFYSC
jgi:hypothetical protein